MYRQVNNILIELSAEEQDALIAEQERVAAVFTENSNRQKRNTILAETDWTQMPDSPLTEEQKTAYATYRQALRDITSHANWPKLEEADWPVKPA